MPNVSITQLVNGTTADASVVDSNLNAIAAVLNGGIDPTNITAASLTEATMVTSLRPSTFLPYITKPFVVSGMTIATSASLSTTIASGTVVINGKVVTFASTPLTVVLSKDTYIDIKDDGSVVQVAVANNATSGMTLTTNSDGSNALRIAKVVSSATAITQVLQGTFNMSPVSPNTLNWFGFDALGNAVYNCNPNPTNIGYAQVTSNSTTTSLSATSIAALSVPAIIPFGRKVKVTLWGSRLFNNTNSDGATIYIFNAASLGTLTTQIATNNNNNPSGTVSTAPGIAIANVTPSAGLTYYNAAIAAVTGGTTSLDGATTSPSFISVDLE